MQACSSTHRPISTISPDCSARGIMVAGAIGPRPGLSQRNNASAPMNRPVDGTDDGLVLQSELASFLRPAQRHPKIHVVLSQVMGFQIDDLETGSPLPLGLVHGDVGGVEQLFGIVIRLAGEGDSDAGGYLDFDTGKDEGHSERVGDPGGDDLHLFVAIQLLAQDHELVSRQSSDGVGRVSACTSRARPPQSGAHRRPGGRSESLTALKWSRSTNRAATTFRDRPLRTMACSIRSNRSTRLGSPVKASCIDR